MKDLETVNMKSKLNGDTNDVVLYSVGANNEDGSTNLPVEYEKPGDSQNLSTRRKLSMFVRGPTFTYWKNLAGLSGGVLSLLTAYNSLFYVQSSLHSKDGLGTAALAVDYAAQVIACMFVPTLLMKKIGPKWTLILAMVGIATYLAANLYATFATLIPTAIFMGVGFAAMWATMNTVVNDLARGYAEVTGSDQKTTISRFFGIYYMIIEQGKIWGNLISSQVLAPPAPTGNETVTSTKLKACGSSFCDQKVLKRIAATPAPSTDALLLTTLAPIQSHQGQILEEQLWVLCGIALGFCCVAVFFILLLLDSRKPHLRNENILQHIVSTVKFMADPNLILLIVITIAAGLVQSFYISDITKAFFTCSLGIHHVGLVSICYGLVVVLGSICMGYLAQLVGRIFLVCMAVVLHIADMCFMLYWTPDPDQIVVFYLIACVWAICVAIWLIQLTALYGQVFEKNHEESFSNHRLWECIGFVIGFAWGHYLCMSVKIYAIIVILIVGLAGYLATEIRVRILAKRQEADEKSSS